MAWAYLKLSQLEELKNLIQMREHCCMNFSAIFRKKYLNYFAESGATNGTYQYESKGMLRNLLFPRLLGHEPSPHSEIKNIVVHRSEEDNSLDFSFKLTENGKLLPICSNNITSKVINLGKGLELFGSSLSKVNTVMGDKKSVNNILKTCFSSKKASEGDNSFCYYTMTLDKAQGAASALQYLHPRLHGLNIRLAGQKDLENLMPLQKNYEIEEVLPRPEVFNKAISKKNLTMVLRNQITVVAEKAGKIVAKANTNEKGFVYHQIGGVYTLPEYRNSGISTILVSYLLENIFSTGMKASLFVKTSNSAALKVYEKLGFSKNEEFQITYFN